MQWKRKTSVVINLKFLSLFERDVSRFQKDFCHVNKQKRRTMINAFRVFRSNLAKWPNWHEFHTTQIKIKFRLTATFIYLLFICLSSQYVNDRHKRWDFFYHFAMEMKQYEKNFRFRCDTRKKSQLMASKSVWRVKQRDEKINFLIFLSRCIIGRWFKWKTLLVGRMGKWMLGCGELD